MTSAVVLSLSVAMLVLLLGAYVATTRPGRRARAARGGGAAAPAQPPPGPGDGPRMPVSAGKVGSDYPDPRTIKVGDRVDCHGMLARVAGAMYLSWQGREWTDYLLDDGSRRDRRLSVAERGGAAPGDPMHLEVQLWTSVPTQGMVPAKSMLIMEGMEFFPVERGTAAFRSEGNTGRPERGLLDFAEYRAADGRLLSFQRVQGRPWSASYANPLPPGSIQIERPKS